MHSVERGRVIDKLTVICAHPRRKLQDERSLFRVAAGDALIVWRSRERLDRQHTGHGRTGVRLLQVYATDTRCCLNV